MSTYVSQFSTCRVCKVMAHSSSMIKYGVRHYAHPKCGLERWGAAFFDRLQDWRVERFPALVAIRAGLWDELERRCQAIQAKGAA